MKSWYIGFVLVLVVGVLAGCSGGETASESADEGGGETYASASLDTSYDGALTASSQLVLGTLKLEETANAVTSEQAATLLPLWQALRGGVTAQAEVDAVLKQIEGTMTQEQLATITAMQLTQEDLRAWMEEQGLRMGGGFPGAGGDMSEEEREAARATRQAQSGGEGMPGGGEMPPEMATRRAEFENMSDEEREEMRATMQAGGGFPGGTGAGGRGGADGRQFIFLLNPLIELLEARAGET
jgi:hypothetical protein